MDGGQHLGQRHRLVDFVLLPRVRRQERCVHGSQSVQRVRTGGPEDASWGKNGGRVPRTSQRGRSKFCSLWKLKLVSTTYSEEYDAHLSQAMLDSFAR